MLLLNGKSFVKSKKDLKFIYLWASIALEFWLDIDFVAKNQEVEWLVMIAWCFQPNYCGKSFFRSQKNLKLIYLWPSIA